MITHYMKIALLFCSIILFSLISGVVNAKVKGIYVTQYSLENTAFLNYLIKHAKEAGIDTFVVDLELPSQRYANNIKLVQSNNIKYVARIIVFPNGGTSHAIKTPEVWQKKYRLVKQAIEYGAKEIQLDYIRYSSKEKPSDEHAKDINKIISWYKNQLSGQNIPLQIDVFGITSFGESKHIGQNIELFSKSVDAICPMVYPSHYRPFEQHFKTPYATVFNSLTNIRKMFNQQMPIRMYAYIELSNYHYPMPKPQRLEYIKAQIKAVEAANADGWYAWSPHNRYDYLFEFLNAQKGIHTKIEPLAIDESGKIIRYDPEEIPAKSSNVINKKSANSSSKVTETKNNEKPSVIPNNQQSTNKPQNKQT